MISFDRFDKRAQQSLHRAYEIMSWHGHTALDVEHVLLALLIQPDGMVPSVLGELKVDIEKVHRRISDDLRSRSHQEPGHEHPDHQLLVTSRMQMLTARADEEATRCQAERVASEHLLLAMLREEDSSAVVLLASLGMTYDRVRSILDNRSVRNDPDSHARPGISAPPASPTRPGGMMLSKKVLIAQIQSEVEKFQSLLAEAEQCRQAVLANAETEHQAATAKAKAEYERAMRSAQETYQADWAKLAEQFNGIVAAYPEWARIPWGDARWRTWTTPADAAISAVRLGEVAIADAWQQLRGPLLVPLHNARGVVIRAPEAAKPQAMAAVQAMILRLLAMVAPGQLRLTFVDPIGLGHNVAPFMKLGDYDPLLISGKAWTETRHIEQQLADLSGHMENVIQQYLRNEFATIQDYNADRGVVAEPYRFLVVMDYPAAFSEEAARRLLSIAANGSRCGVYTVVVTDPAVQPAYGVDIKGLETDASVFAWEGKSFVWDQEGLRDTHVTFDAPPDASLFDAIIAQVGEGAKSASRVEVPFERIVPERTAWWKADSRTGISIPLGPAGARRSLEFSLGSGTRHHVLVAGRVGSGKTTLMHTLITNLALTYSPDELELYLIDFKKGVGFKPYAVHHLPHARVIAIESEREFGLSVLQGLNAEFDRRGDLLRGRGGEIGPYRNQTGEHLPRILLIVDEFHDFFAEDDPISTQAAQILDHLVREGRGFGIHVLLGSQTLAGINTLGRSTLDQMGVRIALQCSDADSRLILAEDNPAARQLTRPGEAIYNDNNGLVESNTHFQVAYLSEQEHEEYLGAIEALAEKEEYRPGHPQIVFEGNEPADVRKNADLEQVLSRNAGAKAATPRAWLGEPMAIRGPVAAVFHRQPSDNLLMVSQDAERGLGMLSSCLLSLAAQLPGPGGVPVSADGVEPRIAVLDFGAVDGDGAGHLAALAEILPQITIRRRHQLGETLKRLAAEVRRRLDAEEYSAPDQYLFINGLQRARDLSADTSFYGPIDPEQTVTDPGQQLALILREGPDVGIHVVAWCDTVANLLRRIDRSTLQEFGMRVAMQMGIEDSTTLVDAPAASRLGPYKAVFFHESESRTERFRPYDVPPREWLEAVARRIAGQ